MYRSVRVDISLALEGMSHAAKDKWCSILLIEVEER